MKWVSFSYYFEIKKNKNNRDKNLFRISIFSKLFYIYVFFNSTR